MKNCNMTTSKKCLKCGKKLKDKKAQEVKLCLSCFIKQYGS